ncbi:histidine phosphatase family protein [Luedemannella flava]
MVMAELTVVRHGQSEANLAFAAAEAAGRLDSGVVGRDVDVPLSPLGRAQALAVGRRLAGMRPSQRPQVVVCSPYRRAGQTWELARAAAHDMGADLPSAYVDDRVGDRVMGRLELMTSAAIEAGFPKEAARRREVGEFAYRPPGGESFDDIAVRLARAVTDLHARHAGQRVWVIAHDAVVLVMRRLIENLTPAELAAVVVDGPVANASFTRFAAVAGRLRLTRYNDVEHLAEVGRDREP